MILVKNISTDAFQEHSILFEDSSVILQLRFVPIIESWFFSASYKTFSVNGIRLCLAKNHIMSRNKPFDFTCTDTSNNGIDPFKIDDFSEGRCQLFMYESADMEAQRGGVAVPK